MKPVFDLSQYDERKHVAVYAAYDVGYSEFEHGKNTEGFTSADEQGLAYAEAYVEAENLPRYTK